MRETFLHTVDDRNEVAMLVIEVEKSLQHLKNNLAALVRRPQNLNAARQVASHLEALEKRLSGASEVALKFRPAWIYDDGEFWGSGVSGPGPFGPLPKFLGVIDEANSIPSDVFDEIQKVFPPELYPQVYASRPDDSTTDAVDPVDLSTA